MSLCRAVFCSAACSHHRQVSPQQPHFLGPHRQRHLLLHQRPSHMGEFQCQCLVQVQQTGARMACRWSLLVTSAHRSHLQVTHHTLAAMLVAALRPSRDPSATPRVRGAASASAAATAWRYSPAHSTHPPAQSGRRVRLQCTRVPLLPLLLTDSLPRGMHVLSRNLLLPSYPLPSLLALQ